jgi:hypothetical protein
MVYLYCMKPLIPPSALEALYPQQLVEKHLSPARSVPALLQAGDLLGLTDAERARALSVMGDPPNSLHPGKTRNVTRSMLQEWRTGRRPIPAWHRARLAAYLEFAIEKLRKLARTAGIPSTSPIWAEYDQVEKIINKELNNSEILTAVKAYRQGFKAVEETPAGRFFLERQEKRILELVGKKQ